MAHRIKSFQNDHIRLLKKLHLKKFRYEKGLFIAEGQKAVEGLIASGKWAEECYFSASFAADKPEEAGRLDAVSKKSFVVDDEVFKRITTTESPAGVLAVVDFIDVSPASFFSKREDFLYLSRVRDPGNVGTIIRIADASGFSGVVLSPDSADPYNPKVVRSTAGSIFNLNIVTGVELEETIDLARRNQFNLYAADPHEGEDVFTVKAKRPLAILLGGEAKGLPLGIQDKINGLLRIPMKGKAESLNVAAATAVICFAINR